MGKIAIVDFMKGMFVDQLQEIDNACLSMYHKMSIDIAEGVELDYIGEFLIQSRNGLTDGVYRLFLKAKAAVISSRGTVDDILVALELFLNNDVVYLELYPMYIEIYTTWDNWPLTYPKSELRNLIKGAVMGGVRVGDIHTIVPASNLTFGFSELTSQPNPNFLGFADLATPGQGGQFSEVY